MIQMTIGKPDAGMDTFQFIASLAGSFASLAWPCLIAFVLWLFRTELRERLTNITSATIAGQQLQFALKRAEESIEAVDANGEVASASTAPEPSKIEAASHGMAFDSAEPHTEPSIWLSAINSLRALSNANTPIDDPQTAILQSWNIIDKLVKAIAEKHGVQTNAAALGATWQTAKGLAERKILSAKLMVTLRELSNIRNQVAHGGVSGAQDGIRYFDLASRFIDALRPLS